MAEQATKDEFGDERQDTEKWNNHFYSYKCSGLDSRLDSYLDHKYSLK